MSRCYSDYSPAERLSFAEQGAAASRADRDFLRAHLRETQALLDCAMDLLVAAQAGRPYRKRAKALVAKWEELAMATQQS